MYRGASGLKCAAGCLISDDEYDASFEDNTWISLVITHKVPGNHRHLISRLQTIHDTTDPSIWKEELTRLAEIGELNPSILNEEY